MAYLLFYASASTAMLLIRLFGHRLSLFARKVEVNTHMSLFGEHQCHSLLLFVFKFLTPANFNKGGLAKLIASFPSRRFIVGLLDLIFGEAQILLIALVLPSRQVALAVLLLALLLVGYHNYTTSLLADGSLVCPLSLIFHIFGCDIESTNSFLAYGARLLDLVVEKVLVL